MSLILILGGALLGLPVLIHLIMKQEPKRLPFPALRFLKQKQRTTTRKLRLRHFLLLAMRMLLIGLFALALFQPKIPSRFADLGLDLGGGRPIAAIIIIDTTPSMGYMSDRKTRLEEAVRRALELLEQIPPASKVAIITTAEPNAPWELTVSDARRKLENLKTPDAVSRPLTSLLPSAYALFAAHDAENGSQTGEAWPRLVALFSDRTLESWKSDRAEDLKAGLERLAEPKPVFLYFDVGVENPTNVSLVSAEVRPAVLSSGAVVTVTALVQSTGIEVAASRVKCQLSEPGFVAVQDVPLRAGVPTPVSFVFRDVKPGWHQAEVILETPDNLGPDGVPGFDNIRYVTFKIGTSRKMLTICDEPTDAALWKIAHEWKNDITCDVIASSNVTDFTGYDLICLLSVSDPAKRLKDGDTLWVKLKSHIDRGGKALVIPGGLEQITLTSYDPNGPAAGIMPGKITRLVDAATFPDDVRKLGVTWDIGNDAALRHPLVAPFKGWKLSGVDFILNPRKAWKYWEVEASRENIIIDYADEPEASKRRPALLEKTTPTGGKVVLLTTRMDWPWEPARKWHNYYDTAESHFAVVFPNLLVKYLTGESAESQFQYQPGQAISLPLGKGTSTTPQTLIWEGPGVNADDSTVKLEPNQAEWRLAPARNTSVGQFTMRNQDRKFEERYSINIPAEESQLAKVEPASIEALTGPDSVIAVGKGFDLTAMLAGRTAEVSLLPWLLLGLLLLFAAEGLLANRFYGVRRKT
ncbi:MAG: BatA domain-containing protein [Fimbriiglobus sp.]